MKKTTRVLVALLALTLITSCFVGGTFAKYVTQASGTDSARVAKFGVTASINGSAFASSYAKDDDTFTLDANTVVSDTKVVAPGTEGTFTGIAITGTPEVAVRLVSTADLDLGDKWVDADGDYYCPIKITVNGNEYYGLDYADVDAFEAAVEADILTAANADYKANTDLSAVTGLNGNYAWEWAYESTDGTEVTASDVKDTFLGDEAAAGRAADISLTVSTTITQID